MTYTLYPATGRGHTKIDWLDSYHIFSFDRFHDPGRMGFGALRVLNDDKIGPAAGFPLHPHRDFEIVTIVLDGTLEHTDSMGNRGTIEAGDVQRMSAGTGVTHSERNPRADYPVHLLQVWVAPAKDGTVPSYEQRSYDFRQKTADGLVKLVSGTSSPDTVGIGQDAFFWYGNLPRGGSGTYGLRDSAHGVFAYLISGKASIGNHTLAPGDGLGITGEKGFTITARDASKLLLIEVPMN